MSISWKQGPVVAWTESDGPGRVPPVPSRRLAFASATALTVAVFGVLTANTVCPEHALWIDAIASVTLVLTITAIVATLKASATSAALTLAASCGGLSIAGVDAFHEVTRSRLVALAFAVAGLLSAFSAVTAIRLRHWEAHVLDDALRPLPSMSEAAPHEATFATGTSSDADVPNPEVTTLSSS